MRRTALTALIALMVALAGCGATTQGPSGDMQTSDATIEPTSGTLSGSSGTVAFYVSDQPAAIEDFEHLNVTIEKVGLKPAGADGDDLEGEENETDDDADDREEENETADGDDGEESTTTVTTTTTDAADNETTTTSTETTTVTTTTATPEPKDDAENETETSEPTEADDEAEDETEDEAEDQAEDEAETEEEKEDDENAGWVTYDVDNRTVDLTELQGANATRLANLSAPSGNYTTVFVYVSDINATLTNGEQVNVKLPSQKLQLHTNFQIGDGATTDFVYDIAVHKAGKSGKYILKPNIAESGTNVPIEDVDERDDEDEAEGGPEMEGDDDERDDENESDDANETDEGEMNGSDVDDEMPDEEPDKGADDGGPDAAGELEVTTLGNVTAGENVVIEVTNENGGVAGATVFVDDDRVGTTNGDGQLEITVPDDAEEFEVTVEKAGAEGEFEVELTTEG